MVQSIHRMTSEESLKMISVVSDTVEAMGGAQ